MRVLIATLGSHGDMLPFIGLGQLLRDRGHEVRLYSNGLYTELVRGAGLHFTATSDAQQLREALADPRAVRTFGGMRMIAQAVAESLPVTAAAMERDIVPGATLLIGSTLAFAAHLLAEKHGLPFAVVHLAPSIFRSTAEMPRLTASGAMQHLPRGVKRLLFTLADRCFLDPLFAAPMNRVRRTMGLPAVRGVLSDWVHDADLVLGLFPRWFAPPQDDWPRDVLLTGFPLHDIDATAEPSRELLQFFEQGPPPIVFTAGTANTQSESFYAASAQACAQLGVRGVLVAQQREQLPAVLPAGVIHVRYAPFSGMFPRAALAVHHGGIGTTSQAMSAGVPQLIRPMAYDQFDNAARACRLGIARELLPADYASPRVGRMIGSLIGDASVRTACAAVAASMKREGGLPAACDALEALGRSLHGLPATGGR